MKVKAVPGDILEDRLGLSEEDERTLARSVHIVFHVAAIVKFDAPLKDAVDMNIGGAKKLLELATKMPNLQVRSYGKSVSRGYEVRKIEIHRDGFRYRLLCILQRRTAAAMCQSWRRECTRVKNRLTTY